MRFKTVHLCVLNPPLGVGEVACVRQGADGTGILCAAVVAVVHGDVTAIVHAGVICSGGWGVNMDV